MGFLDALLGRSKPKQADLDALFALPDAGITLQSALGFQPTGRGAVCFRPAEGQAFRQTLDDVVALLDNDDDPDVEQSTDEFGYTWLLARQPDLSALATDLHAVNTSLEAQGFGPALLCSLVSFTDATGRSLALVYLYKRGTFYPFAPAAAGGRQRDNLLELQVRDLLAQDIAVEKDLTKWLALWGAPGL
jgi:hypothetical protein